MDDSITKMFAGMNKVPEPKPQKLYPLPRINWSYVEAVKYNVELCVWEATLKPNAADRIASIAMEEYVADPHASQDALSVVEEICSTHLPNVFTSEMQPNSEGKIAIYAALQSVGFPIVDDRVCIRRKDSIGIVFGAQSSDIERIDLIDDICPKQSVICVTGPAGSRKTRGVLSLLCAFAYGKPAFGKFETHPEREDGTLRRGVLSQWDMPSEACIQWRSSMGDPSGRVGIASFSPLTPANEDFFDSLRDDSIFHESILAFDGLVSLQPTANEREPAFAAPLKYARRFADETGSSCIFIHHSGKDVKGEKTIANVLRGTTAIGADCDVIMYFEQVRGAGNENKTKVAFIKFRDAATKPPSFVFKDLNGLMSICDEKPKTRTPRTDADLVLEAITLNPGRSTAAIAGDLAMPRKRASAAVHELGTRIRVDGAGRASKLFPAA